VGTGSSKEKREVSRRCGEKREKRKEGGARWSRQVGSWWGPFSSFFERGSVLSALTGKGKEKKRRGEHGGADRSVRRLLRSKEKRSRSGLHRKKRRGQPFTKEGKPKSWPRCGWKNGLGIIFNSMGEGVQLVNAAPEGERGSRGSARVPFELCGARKSTSSTCLQHTRPRQAKGKSARARRSQTRWCFTRRLPWLSRRKGPHIDNGVAWVDSGEKRDAEGTVLEDFRPVEEI